MASNHSIYKKKSKWQKANESDKTRSSLQRKINYLDKKCERYLKKLSIKNKRLELVGKFSNIFEEMYPEIFAEVKEEYKRRGYGRHSINKSEEENEKKF